MVGPDWFKTSFKTPDSGTFPVRPERTRGVSDWVLRATMSSSCCWSALTAGSPEEGSWLSDVVVLDELICISLGSGKRQALVTWERGSHMLITHKHKDTGDPHCKERLSLLQPLPPYMPRERLTFCCDALCGQKDDHPAHIQVTQAAQSCRVWGRVGRSLVF